MQNRHNSGARALSAPGASAALLLLALLLPGSAHPQGSAGDGAGALIEPRFLVDVPTAGMLPHGVADFDMNFHQEGGVVAGVSVGLFQRIMLSVSYGGTHIIGTDSPSWNQTPGLAVRVRIVDESDIFPALALGIDTQGKEPYIDSLHRYGIKSPGFFVAASRNYAALGFLSIHGGVNYSLERGDGDTDPNFFLGIEKTLGPVVSVVAEYNLGFNDSNKEALGRGRGYVNAGVRTSFGGGLTLGFNLKDIIRNQQDFTVGNRTLQIEYVREL